MDRHERWLLSFGVTSYVAVEHIRWWFRVVADSLQQFISCDVDTGEVTVWLEGSLLAKFTDRPPWPGVNGVQHYRGHVFVMSSGRALLLALNSANPLADTSETV